MRNKKTIISIIIVIVLAIAAAVFFSTQKFTPSEAYFGIVDEQNIKFEHQDFTKYRFTVGDVISEGELNTERGFGEDENATVIILDWQKPEAEQRYFVRYSDRTESLQMLDNQRKVIPGYILNK